MNLKPFSLIAFMKNCTLIIAFSIISFSVFAESFSIKKQQNLHHYIHFLNQTEAFAFKTLQTFDNYYDQVRDFRNGESSQLNNYICVTRFNAFKIQEKSALNASNKEFLNQECHNLSKIIKAISKQCELLGNYSKDKKYESDNFKGFDEIILEIQELYDLLNKEKNHLDKNIWKIYEDYQKKNEIIYSETYDLMINVLDVEIAFLQDLSLNLNEKIATDFPSILLENNIENLNELLAHNEFKRMESAAQIHYQNFFKYLKQINKEKENYLDQFNQIILKNDQLKNKFYLKCLQHFNIKLVKVFNQFVEAIPDKKGKFIFRSNQIPRLVNVEIKNVTDVLQFKNVVLSQLKIIPQNQSIPKSTFVSLSYYLNFVNENTKRINDAQRSMRSYNYESNLNIQQKNKQQLFFAYDSYNYLQKDVERIEKMSVYLNQDYRRSLNLQLRVLLGVLNEMNNLGKELHKYAIAKKYEEDEFKKSFQILERYALLLHIFDNKKERFYQDIRKIYNSYPNENETETWLKSSDQLLELVDLNRNILFEIKNYFRENTKPKIEKEKLLNQSQNASDNQKELMQGISRFQGEWGDENPHQIYYQIVSNSKINAKSLDNNLNEKTIGYKHPYENFADIYNNIADDFNKFCAFSEEISLLKTVIQPNLLWVKYPKIHEVKIDNVLPIDSIHKELTEIPKIENKKFDLEKDSLKNLAIDSLISIVEPKIKTQTDTVKLIPVPVINAYSSMDGYAPNHLILLLDVSGSMSAAQKLPLLKASFKRLLNILRPEDKITIISYSGSAKLVLPPTACEKNNLEIINALDNLESKGATNINSGIKLAYKIAEENFIENGNNRIILATDGSFIIDDEVYELSKKQSDSEIYLSIFNFGTHKLRRLEKLARKGQGNYEQISQANSDYKLLREVQAIKIK